MPCARRDAVIVRYAARAHVMPAECQCNPRCGQRHAQPRAQPDRPPASLAATLAASPLGGRLARALGIRDLMTPCLPRLCSVFGHALHALPRRGDVPVFPDLSIVSVCLSRGPL